MPNITYDYAFPKIMTQKLSSWDTSTNSDQGVSEKLIRSLKSTIGTSLIYQNSPRRLLVTENPDAQRNGANSNIIQLRETLTETPE